jgi:hypothetical protein
MIRVISFLFVIGGHANHSDPTLFPDSSVLPTDIMANQILFPSVSFFKVIKNKTGKASFIFINKPDCINKTFVSCKNSWHVFANSEATGSYKAPQPQL